MYDIYHTLTPLNTTGEGTTEGEAQEVAESYADAKTNLTNYFQPSKNETFEVFNFRSLVQLEEEPIDKYLTRLREAASRCGFADTDTEIKHQIVFSCSSRKVRRKALHDDPSLLELLKYARTLEKTTAQVKAMEDKEKSVHRVGKRGKYSNRHQKQLSQDQKTKSGLSDNVAPPEKEKLCYFCGGKYPHKKGRVSCPAYGKNCLGCNGRNHFAKCCPKKIHNVERDDTETSESESSEADYVYAVGEKPFPKRADVVIKLEDKKVTFQIDTGASVNIISE